MPTVGNTSTTFSNFNFSGSGTNNQNASKFTMPEDGVIVSLSVCVAADVGQPACNATLAIWNADNNTLIEETPRYFSLQPKSSRSTTGWTFTTINLTTPKFVAAGTNIWIGFYRDPAGSCLFPVASSGSFGGEYENHTGAVPWDVNPPPSWGANGNMGAYATYVKAEGWIWTGSAWSAGLMEVYDGSAWQTPTGLVVWDGSSWVNAT